MTAMSETTHKVWYHCGKCGSLFPSSFGPDEDRLCEECGSKPGTGAWPVREKTAAPESPPEDRVGFDKVGEAADESGRKAVRKKRRTNVMMRVVIIWTFAMLIAVWLRHHYAQKVKEKEKQEAVAGKMTTGTLADERVALLNSALPECHRALGGFLTSGSPEARNQFVVDAIDTAGKMATFYSYNAFPKVDVTGLSRSSQDIIKVGEEWMVSTRWKGKDGIEFDAIFRRDRGTWKLDWQHFNRYSEYPWTLFLSGEGPDEAEFRLLGRLRLSGDEVEQSGARLPFVMLAPEFGKPAETGMESPELIVDRRSDDGILLEAAFAARKNNETIFGEKQKAMEPPGLVRLHVRVKRLNLAGQRSFRLEKIIACHWIDTPLLGFDLEKLKDEMFGN